MLENHGRHFTSVYRFCLPGREVEEQKCSSRKPEVPKGSDGSAPPELEAINQSHPYIHLTKSPKHDHVYQLCFCYWLNAFTCTKLIYHYLNAKIMPTCHPFSLPFSIPVSGLSNFHRKVMGKINFFWSELTEFYLFPSLT